MSKQRKQVLLSLHPEEISMLESLASQFDVSRSYFTGLLIRQANERREAISIIMKDDRDKQKTTG